MKPKVPALKTPRPSPGPLCHRVYDRGYLCQTVEPRRKGWKDKAPVMGRYQEETMREKRVLRLEADNKGKTPRLQRGEKGEKPYDRD